MLLLRLSVVVILGAVSSIHIPECTVLQVNKVDMSMEADCSGKSLQTVPLLDGRKQITKLYLSGNQITILVNQSFNGYENLKEIDLSYNKIKRIEAGAFRDMRGLRELQLSGNVLTSINRYLLADNSSIFSLQLGRNSFRDFPDDSPFLVSPTLASLDLSDCNIAQLPPNFFVGVPNLSHIYLSNNYLTSLSFHAFEHLHRLNVIYLEGNQWNCTCDLIETLEMFKKRNVEITPKLDMCSSGTEKKNITSVINEGSCLQEVFTEQASSDSLATVQPPSIQISLIHKTSFLGTTALTNGNQVTTPRLPTEEHNKEVFTSHAQNVLGMKKRLLFGNIMMTLMCLFVL